MPSRLLINVVLSLCVLGASARAGSAPSPNACTGSLLAPYTDAVVTLSGTATPNPTAASVTTTLGSATLEYPTQNLLDAYNFGVFFIVNGTNYVDYSGSVTLQGTNTVEGSQPASFAGFLEYTIDDPDTVRDSGDESISPPSVVLGLADTDWTPDGVDDVEFAETALAIDVDVGIVSPFACEPGFADDPPTSFTALPPVVFETALLGTCATPPSIPDGDGSSCANTAIGSTCTTWTCDAGYVNAGSDPLCESSGSFSGSFACDTDSDGDGIGDTADNCPAHANASQYDSDGDATGNRCDADFNNDGAVGALDFAIFRANFAIMVPPAPPNADMLSVGGAEPPDNVIGVPDYQAWAPFWAQGGNPGAGVSVPALSPWGTGALFTLLGAVGLGLLNREARSRRRGRAGGAALLMLACVFASRPALAQDVILEWTSTGTDTLEAIGGEQATLEIYVSGFSANGIALVSVSLEFDTDLANELNLVSAEEEPSLLGYGTGLFPITIGPASTTESSDTQAGSVFTLEQHHPVAPVVGDAGKYLVAKVVFDVTGNVATDGADIAVGVFNTGVDGIIDDNNVDISGSVTFGTARVDLQP